MTGNIWPKAFLVDLDNTLHDYRSMAKAARSALANRIEALTGTPADEVLRRYEHLVKLEEKTIAPSARDMRMIRIERLLAGLPGARNIEPGELVAFLEQALFSALRPFDGAIEAFENLRHSARTVIVTEGYDDMQRAVIDRLGISLTDDEFLATHRHGVRKADGSAYRLAHKWLDLPAADITMIGDNWTWDILAAAGVGMSQIWVRGAESEPAKVPANFLGSVSSFRDAPTLISEICRKRGSRPIADSKPTERSGP